MSDLLRVGANIESMQSLNYLNKINGNLALHQARLASGKRINSAEDDTAGYAISRLLQARTTGLKMALSNVGNAKSILSISEGGYQAQMDILQTIKDKVVQAADGSLTTTQVSAINDQISELLGEMDDISEQTKWQGTALFGNTKTFQVGGDATDTFVVALASSDSSAINGGSNDLSAMTVGASAAITTVDGAINDLASAVQDVGDKMARLTVKETALTNSVTNTAATLSRYEDADFAEEQMEVMKLQILQQTAVSALGQANAAPQLVLSLFR